MGNQFECEVVEWLKEPNNDLIVKKMYMEEFNQEYEEMYNRNIDGIHFVDTVYLPTPYYEWCIDNHSKIKDALGK